MKKKLLIAFVVVSMLICVLAACGKECEHSWVEGTTTATCDAAGETTITCSLCGTTQKKSAAALGHQWEFVETVKANCKVGGYDLYTCTRENCDESEHRNETKPDFTPAGHNFQPQNVAATCDKSGYTDNICTVCGDGDGTRVTIPMLGHTYEREGYDGIDGFVPKAPTCEENGEIRYNCTEEGCGASKVITYEEMSGEDAENYKMLGHDFSVYDTYVDATCTVGAYMVQACKNGCGEKENQIQSPALGHTYERDTSEYAYKVILAPTCINIGYQWVVCEECEYCTEEQENKDEAYINMYREAIDATGEHKYDLKLKVVPEFCEVQGYTRYGCSVDGECTAFQDRDYTDALEHILVLTEDKLTNGVPTCLTDGDYPYHCTREGCKYTTININGEKNNGAKHEYVAGQYKVAATCITPAIYNCPNCERDFQAYAEDAENQPHGIHKYDKNPVVTAPTCSTYGYTTFTCSADEKCTATEDSIPVARLAHTFTAPPTENGTIKCDICSAQFINQTTIIWTQENTLCNHKVEGETCDACGIGVTITGTKTPSAPYELLEGVELVTEFKKTVTKSDGVTTEVIETGAALIDLKGDVGTTYIIKVYDKAGELIATYDAINGDINIGKLDVVTSATGSCIIDITEIQAQVGSIAITASTNATVSFYITK